MAAAWEIAGAGIGEVTIVERASALGGLAGSFEQDQKFYPLGYHHILPTDSTLLRFLDLIGALSEVRWRRVHMLFRIDGRLYDFSNPADFFRLPLPLGQKLRFVALMMRAYQKKDWTDWEGRTARELVDAWGGANIREAVFDPLCDLKFELASSDVSAAWMGTRLHAREGSGRLGYIPHTNWTKVLCEGVVRLVQERGVQVRAGVTANRLHARGERVGAVGLENGDTIEADVLVSAMPTNVLARLLPGHAQLDGIQYSALLSLVGVTRQSIPDHFYWLNLLSPRLTASGIFLLTALNPTIGRKGEHCLNFVTHLNSSMSPLFRLSEEEVIARYLDDYRRVFGLDLELEWAHLSRVPAYSPIFRPDYRNPDIRSEAWGNLYLTGNYRTYPSVASTGTALQAGLETGAVVVRDLARQASAKSYRGLSRSGLTNSAGDADLPDAAAVTRGVDRSPATRIPGRGPRSHAGRHRTSVGKYAKRRRTSTRLVMYLLTGAALLAGFLVGAQAVHLTGFAPAQRPRSVIPAGSGSASSNNAVSQAVGGGPASPVTALPP